MSWKALTAACIGCMSFVAAPAHAQVSGEQLINNHGTLPSYSLPYEATSGANRALLVIVFSEYRADEDSSVDRIRFGGRDLVPLGTIEGVRNKRNRMSAFYLPESRIRRGQRDLQVSYNPDDSSSIIYIATLLNIDQAKLGETGAAFSKDCTNGGTAREGVIDFASIAAARNDFVFSFVGSGEDENQVAFNNGATEFFDVRRQNPGFSLAGAVQRPTSTTTVAGSADMSSGCRNRPSTVQLRFTPLLNGTNGTVDAQGSVAAGVPVTIQVTDADLDLRLEGRDSVTVTVRNLRTGEEESVTLLETGDSTGVFRGQLATLSSGPRGSDADGQMYVLQGDRLTTSYFDALTASNGTATRTDTTDITAAANPADLVLMKSVAPAAGNQSPYSVAGSDVIYSLLVTNVGDGPVDESALFVVDTLPDGLRFYNGDAIGGDGNTDPIKFSQAGAGLTFSYATHVGFSSAAVPPASFSECSYSPALGYDPNVRHLCVQPAGAMYPGPSDPNFTLTFRAQVE